MMLMGFPALSGSGYRFGDLGYSLDGLAFIFLRTHFLANVGTSLTVDLILLAKLCLVIGSVDVPTSVAGPGMSAVVSVLRRESGVGSSGGKHECCT